MTDPPTPLLTRIEPLRPPGLCVRIHLAGDEPLEVTLEALELSRLGVGDTLTPPTRHNLLNADADVRVRQAALNLLSYRARTRQELRLRLRQKGFSPARIDPCLERLAARGLLDDTTVATAFVRDRLRLRPRGRAQLMSELRAKGVGADLAQEIIEQVFEEEEVSDTDLARAAVEAWLSRQPADVKAVLLSDISQPKREKARRRLYGYLVRRGFRGASLSEAMDSLIDLA